MYLQSDYDVARCKEKAPHLSYGEKLDSIKNLFVLEKALSLSRNNKIFTK